MTKYLDALEKMEMKGRLDRNNRLLSKMVAAAYEKSNQVRAIFDDLKLKPSDIQTLQDIKKLPVISREKLIELESAQPPYGGFENPDVKIDRIFTSPGPVYEPHLSESDHLWARAYFAAGIRESDIVLNAFSYHMVAAGLTFHNGLRAVGATVVPSGVSGTQQQVQLMHDLGCTAFTGTPSFLMAIIRKAEEMGYDFKKDFRIKKACFAAEPLQPALRQAFENDYGIDTYQMYGATEVGDVAYECGQKKGWHICEEVIVEIVNPADGKEVEPGALGEVVVTRFNHIFFLFRFGTGDLSRLIAEPCPCGRTSLRLDGIAGRVGDAVKVRGLFVAPSQLKKISETFNDAKLQIVVSRAGHEDFLTIKLESANTGLEEKLNSYFKDICTVRADKVEILKPGTLGEDQKMIVDERTW
ncbi:MAG: AMP-binding protein [Deltaproteobacteria bacterium]|nr:AMP-binding protein [Deltaproteobacteria bacterium]